MPQKSGAACVISHHSSFNYEGPAFLMRSRAFLLWQDAQTGLFCLFGSSGLSGLTKQTRQTK
jgi:hypothetical protein